MQYFGILLFNTQDFFNSKETSPKKKLQFQQTSTIQEQFVKNKQKHQHSKAEKGKAKHIELPALTSKNLFKDPVFLQKVPLHDVVASLLSNAKSGVRKTSTQEVFSAWQSDEKNLIWSHFLRNVIKNNHCAQSLPISQNVPSWPILCFTWETESSETWFNEDEYTAMNTLKKYTPYEN